MKLPVESIRSGSVPVAVNNRRADLQGMRAVAVVAVFAHHLFDWPSGGFVGVDVFFVLSGFFITGILIRERTATGALSFRDFYVRRVKRILPSATLVLAVTVFGAYLLFPASRARETLLDALYAAIFGANFRFEAVGADYFQQGQPPSPIQHYWSLSIEEQFYFVWPALLVLIFAVTRKFGRRHNREFIRQWGLFSAMAGIVLASFGWALFLSAANPNSAYFSTFTRVWELGVGAMVAIIGPWIARIPASVRPTLAYVGLTGVLVSLFLINSAALFPAPWAALPVLSTALVVTSFHGAEVRGVPFLTNRVAAYLGDTSYTLYLWHLPVIVLLQTVLPKGVLYYLIAVALALALTMVTYRFYEDPIRKSNWLLDQVNAEQSNLLKLSPMAWCVAGATAVVAVVALIANMQYADKLAVARELVAAAERVDQRQAIGPEQIPDAQDPCFGAPAMVTPGCVLRNPLVPLEPPIELFAKDNQGQLECFLNKDSKAESVPSCKYGSDGEDAVRIALVGDSHAAAILPALWPVLDSNNWSLTTYLGIGCHFADPTPPVCRQPMAGIQADLAANRYDLVLVTNFNQGLPPESYQAAWTPVLAAGSRIAVVPDNPHTTAEALACLTRISFGEDQTGECGSPRSAAFTREDPLISAVQLVPGATLIDLTRYYCTDAWCPSVIGNVIVYRDLNSDNSHITATYASTLAQAMQEGIKRALTVP
jgi:peptidoglycan/LPS O-acetylase OafA/YrhL